MELANKVAVVTGAASGIGLEIVRLYLQEGAKVVAVDIAADLATRLGPFAADHPESLRCVVGDVALEETAARYTREALDAFGRIDVMVNNAGVGSVTAIDETSPEEWDRVMSINVKSIYWSARAVVPVMKKQGGGLFLNTGSISSVTGIPGQGVYGPSKGAVIQITRQMAVEYGKDGIRSNAVCPGTVDTPLLQKAATDTGDPAGFLKMLADGHPIGRIAASEEIAQFFVFLASDRARFFTGSILMLDGGYTAR
jgi:NAD(P)-dependent dehydrogenase (short-subunit alcohol dehydrogenase family)